MAMPCHTDREVIKKGNAMPARFWLATMLVFSATVLPGEALADQRALSALAPSLPSLGSRLEDVRTMALPEGLRLICEADEGTPKLADPQLLKRHNSRDPSRVKFCTIIAPGSEAGWELASIPSLAGPARLWLLFVEQGGGGRHRLARVSLWAHRDGWDKVASTLTDLLGQPDAGGDSLLIWEDEQHETLMFLDPKSPDEFAVAVADLRLRKLLKSPGLSNRSD
ncbi:conserved exported hypothetical protein [Magnetospirillum molischianum DSM 120]|uniref:Uncharacterized protein n=2 Tax=Magnetospirillum molischianum TaxID=1083 RepID=H8FW71_MAGML|nr:conserved exported hypothetical protein [Magnetospirillum molischianum DSM 120]